MSTEALTVSLTANLDMTAARPLAQEILEARGQPLILDASSVRRLGGQCLQVLIGARAAWAEDKVAFQIADPSAEFTEVLSLLGAPDLSPVHSEQD